MRLYRDMTTVLLLKFLFFSTMVETKTYFGAQKKSYSLYSPLNISDSPVLKFKLKTTERDGLLLYIDDHLNKRGNGNYFQLQIFRSRLEITLHVSYPVNGNSMNVHSQSRRRHMGVHLNDNHYHFIDVELNTNKIKISLDGEPLTVAVKEKDGIHLNSSLYIGGVPSLERTFANFHIIYEKHFTGCISHLRLQNVKSDMTVMRSLKANEEHGTATGCQNMCFLQDGPHCLHGGRCLNKYVTAACDCRGTGFQGKICKIPSPSIYLSGSDYLSWKPDEVLNDRSGEIFVRFRAAKSSGIILYAFGDDAEKEFMLLELSKMSLFFTYKCTGCSSETIQLGNKEINQTIWRYVNIYRHGNSISLKLDDGKYQRRYTKSTQQNSKSGDNVGYLRIRNLFVGGTAHSNSIKASQSKTHFAGCIQDLFINQVDFLGKLNNVRSAHNIGRYGHVEKGCHDFQYIRDNNVMNYSDTSSSFIGKFNTYPKAKTHKDGIIHSHRKVSSKNNLTWLLVGVCIAVIIITLGVILLARHYYQRKSKNQRYRSEYIRQNHGEDTTSFLHSKSIKNEVVNACFVKRLGNSETNRMQTFSPDRKVFYASPEEIMAKRQSSEESL